MGQRGSIGGGGIAEWPPEYASAHRSESCLSHSVPRDLMQPCRTTLELKAALFSVIHALVSLYEIVGEGDSKMYDVLLGSEICDIFVTELPLSQK